MLKILIQEVFATLRNPRGYAREVMIPRNYALPELVTMGALAACLYGILTVILVQMIASIDDPNLELAGLDQISAAQAAISIILNVALGMVLTSVGAWKIGEMAGGTGGPSAVAAAVVWHSLCIIVAVPVFVVVGVAATLVASVTGLNLFVFATVIAVFLYSLWLEASLIGEAHGFSGTRVVALCLLGGHAVVGIITNAILS